MDENSTQTWTLYDGGNPIMDFNGSGSLTMRYLWGPTGIVARQTSGGTVSWYLADRLGTVRDLISNSGSIIDHVDFSAFGTVLDESNPTSGDRMMGFAMLERDTVTGLNLAVNREENPDTGRWDSQDPLGFGGGDQNTYRYAENAPNQLSDPTGLYTRQYNNWLGGRNKWTLQQRSAVETAFANVAARMAALIAQIDAEMESLSPCLFLKLGSGLAQLRQILRKIDRDSKGAFTVEIYHGSLDPNQDAIMDGDETNSWFDPELTYNDDNGWQQLPQSALDALTLHELSHLYGSRDLKQVPAKTPGVTNAVFPPWFRNAEAIAKLMNSDLDHWLDYLNAKTKAIRACNC